MQDVRLDVVRPEDEVAHDPAILRKVHATSEMFEHLFPYLEEAFLIINELDSSGEVMLSFLVSKLRTSGIDVSFSGLNDHVLDVLKRTRLHDKIGEDHFYVSVAQAVSLFGMSMTRSIGLGNSVRKLLNVDMEPYGITSDRFSLLSVKEILDEICEGRG